MKKAASNESFFTTWQELHGGVELSGIVRGWLRISLPVARALWKVRVSANSLTLLGVVSAVLLWHYSAKPFAIAFLALSLLCDGLDGSLSIIWGKSGPWGGVLDSVADRLGEFFWALTFYELGASWWIIAIAWLAAFVQEYSRARLASLVGPAVELVSICERPVRAAFLAVALIVDHLHHSFVEKVAIFWFTFQLVACAMVLMEAFTRIRAVDSVDDELGADSDQG